MSNHVNKSLIELWDAATALHDVVEKAKSIPPSRKAKPLLDAIEASRPFIDAVASPHPDSGSYPSAPDRTKGRLAARISVIGS
jgi:hypothetical protein